jgi:hypothetical protein
MKKERDCYLCRAGEQFVTAKYGGIISTRCTLRRDSKLCKRRLYTYAELIAAQEKIRKPILHPATQAIRQPEEPASACA